MKKTRTITREATALLAIVLMGGIPSATFAATQTGEAAAISAPDQTATATDRSGETTDRSGETTDRSGGMTDRSGGMTDQIVTATDDNGQPDAEVATDERKHAKKRQKKAKSDAENAGTPVAEADDDKADPGDGIPGFRFPQVTLEIPDTPLVRKYRAMYTTPEGLKYLETVIRRPALYRDFIRAETARLEVPECLFYLPVIESGFSQTAVSRSGATGVWQFMRNSVSGYGIRINDWMDERRDPWLTTTAAIKKLKENYADLGDWYLALAAYNCGLGATRRAIKKAGTNDYWYLAEHGFLKRETVHYVPKFLAIAEILSKSEEYGIDWGETPEKTDALTTIPVKRPVDISVLAKETGMDAKFLKSVNPALFYSITPPDTLYGLRIPQGQEDAVKTVLDDRSKMLLEYYMYKIKSGDTLYALALHYGISIDMILQYNPGLKPNALKIGKNIVIPAIKEVAAYKGKQDSGPVDFSGTYLVKKGDTLWSIALAHNVQVETLAERNDLEVNSVLKLGKVLRVPIL